MKKLIFPGVFAAIALSACSGGASGEKLIGSWTCDGPDRPNMEFKAGGGVSQRHPRRSQFTTGKRAGFV